jgi:hypothetical protein
LAYTKVNVVSVFLIGLRNSFFMYLVIHWIGMFLIEVLDHVPLFSIERLLRKLIVDQVFIGLLQAVILIYA